MTAPTYGLTQAQMLREQARLRPDAPAIRQKEFGIWRPLSWAGYYERAQHVGHGLRALGLAPGGHIGILSENRIEWVLSQLGAGLVGAITVGVYSTSPANEIAYVLGNGDVEIVICEDQEQADKVLASIAHLPRLKKIVVIEKKGFDETHALDPERVVRFADMEALGAQHRHDHPDLVDACLDAQQAEASSVELPTVSWIPATRKPVATSTVGSPLPTMSPANCSVTNWLNGLS